VSDRQRQLNTSLSTSTPSQSKMMRSGLIIASFPNPDKEHILRQWAITLRCAKIAHSTGGASDATAA
jgi:hypothetical protein